MARKDDSSLTAVILAAGMGSRLGKRTSDLPKTLVDVGPAGETILDLLLARIAACGIARTYIVTGYRADRLEEHLAGTAPGSEVRLVFNPEYDTMNNARSLLCLREELDGRAFVKFDGDLVIDPGILPELMESDAASATLVDSVRPLVDEDMKAAVDPSTGMVTGFGKHLPNSAFGVSIGIERIGADHSAVVFDAIERMIYAEGRGDLYYEDAYARILGKGLTMQAVSTKGLPWQEVDDETDLARARGLAASFA